MLGMFAAKIILLEYARRSKVGQSSKMQVRKFKWPGKDIRDNLGNLIRSFVTGAFIGFLPGLGAPTSTVIAYSNEKSLSKETEKWGKGHIGGVIAPEVANNAGIGGAMIPMLALGIPGDAIMIQLMAVMAIHGVNAGPMLMKTNPDMFYMIMVAGLVAGIFVLIAEVWGMPLFPKFVSLPYHYLYPAIIVISFIGAYMITGTLFGVAVAVCACLLGLAMDYFEISPEPFIMTYILSTLLEKNIRQGFNYSLTGGMEFFTHPISLVFILLGIVVVFLNVIKPAYKRAKAKKTAAKAAE